MSLITLRSRLANTVLFFISISLLNLSTKAEELAYQQPENGEFHFQQSIGTGYSTGRGFMAIHRIDAQGGFWLLSNDFAIILDRLAFTLRQDFGVTEFLNLTAEVPTTMDWQGPSRFVFGYAGRGKINIHNRKDHRDEHSGWSLWAEAAFQANGQDGISQQIASFAPSLLNASPTSRYRASAIGNATFFNDFLAPSLSVSSFYDMGSLKPTDVMISGSVVHIWGARDLSTRFTITIPAVTNQMQLAYNGPNQSLTPPPLSTRFVLEQNWMQWMGRIETGDAGSALLLGYKL